MPESYREPDQGESLRDYLHDMLREVVRTVTGSGVMQAGGEVNIVHPSSSAETTAISSSYLARITQSKEMIVPSELGIRPHPYKFVFGFREVTLEEQCFDSQGQDIDFAKCGGSTNRYVRVVNVTGGREGDIQWPTAVPASKKWAVNLWELTHKTHAGEGQSHYIYGVDIRHNAYPPTFAPVGPGQGGRQNVSPIGDLQVSEFVVLMNEMTDKNGQTIRYFNFPGLHIGTCYG